MSPLKEITMDFSFKGERSGKPQVSPYRLAKFQPGRGCLWLGEVRRRGCHVNVCAHMHVAAGQLL